MISYFKSYLKTTVRIIVQNKVSSLINIVGLVAGFSGFILIALFVLDELKFDRHFLNSNRLYRITSRYAKEGQSHSSAQTPAQLAPRMMTELPEVEAATRLMVPDEAFLFPNEKVFKETIIFTDSSFLRVFGFDLVQGDPLRCLSNRSSIILCESMAEKLYGMGWKEISIIGESILIDGYIPMTVTGIFKDMPSHSHFHSSIFASVPAGEDTWMGEEDRVFTYLLLRNKTNISNLQNKIGAWTSQLNQKGELKISEYKFQKVTDIHLYTDLEEDLTTQGSIHDIYTLVMIAGFLIITSVINFMNLYAAQTSGRFKEVGVRKILGAFRRQLHHQFMLEASLLVFASIGVSVLVTFVLLPSFNVLTRKTIALSNVLELPPMLLLFVAGILTVALAGSYPATFLSSRNAMETLKGKLTQTKSFGMRNSLMIFQFCLSTIMIILTWIALRQMEFVKNKPLGYDKNQIVILRNPYMLGKIDKIKTFRDALLKVTGVEHVSITGYTPAQKRWEKFRMTFSILDQQSSVPANWMLVDEGFIETMGIELLEGRNFSDNHQYESHSIILNEKAVAAFNLRSGGAWPIGHELSYKDGDTPGQHFQIIGIVKDFNFSSLHDEVKPIVLRAGYHRFEMALRLEQSTSSTQVLEDVQNVWQKFAPDIPFEYAFMSERFNQLHQSDSIVGSVFSKFSMLTILIALLGLFSMITHTILRKTKEIGIRKVLGASEKNIVWMLSADFLKRIILANMIAIPIAWILANSWLNTFASKIEMAWWIFLGTILGVLLLAVLTLGYQSIKASLANPVHNLRHE